MTALKAPAQKTKAALAVKKGKPPIKYYLTKWYISRTSPHVMSPVGKPGSGPGGENTKGDNNKN